MCGVVPLKRRLTLDSPEHPRISFSPSEGTKNGVIPRAV